MTGQWHRPSGCNSSACVEVTVDGPAVLVRSSRDPDGPRLTLSLTEWQALLDGVRAGEFDLPDPEEPATTTSGKVAVVVRRGQWNAESWSA